MSDAQPAAPARPNDNEALQEVRDQARAVRQQFIREWNYQGGVSDETLIKGGEVAVAYRDLLIDYREQVSTPDWDERDLDWIMEYVGEQVTREVEKPGRGRGTRTEAVPAFVTIDPADLFQLTKKFDQIWRDLGFGAETTEGRDLHKIPDGSERDE